MSSKKLDKFGEILISHVRDKAIIEWDKIVEGRQKGRTAESFRAELDDLGPEVIAVINNMIPKIVDSTVHHLLWMFEQEDSIKITVTNGDGGIINVCDESDGLTGELYGFHGWINRFSKERHN